MSVVAQLTIWLAHLMPPVQAMPVSSDRSRPSRSADCTNSARSVAVSGPRAVTFQNLSARGDASHRPHSGEVQQKSAPPGVAEPTDASPSLRFPICSIVLAKRVAYGKVPGIGHGEGNDVR